MNAIAAVALRSDLSQRRRRREDVLPVRLKIFSFNFNSYLPVVQNFYSSQIRVLIPTNVAARDLVIFISLPQTSIYLIEDIMCNDFQMNRIENHMFIDQVE